jgi:hypothetical protein
MTTVSTSREDWMRRLGPLYGGAVALVHSTPWRWPDSLSRDALAGTAAAEARSPFWVVAVGLPIGLVAYVAAMLVSAIGLPSPIAALLGLAVMTFASAALVERGVVERIDRVSSSPSVLAILVLVFGTLVRAAAIVSVPSSSSHWLGVFVVTALVGRWAAVFLQGLGDPILDDDAPRSLVVAPPPAWLTGALSIGVAVVVGLALGKVGILALVLAAAASFALGLDAQRRDRGLSAPVVACAAAIAELVVLLAATV